MSRVLLTSITGTSTPAVISKILQGQGRYNIQQVSSICFGSYGLLEKYRAPMRHCPNQGDRPTVARAGLHYNPILHQQQILHQHQNPVIKKVNNRNLPADVYKRNITVELRPGKKIEVNLTWLRDNCTCDECYNHSTHQRNVFFHHLTSEALEVSSIISEGQLVKVNWKDSHVSHYDVTRLANYSSDSAQADPPVEKKLWTARDLEKSGLPRVEFSDLMNTPRGKATLLEGLLRYGVATVVGVPATLEGTLEAAGRVSRTQRTLFGDHWTFGNPDVDEKFEDTAYTNSALGAHTDGTYFTSPAGVLILHCISRGVIGGESLLIDGFKAAERLRQADPESFRILSQHFSVDHLYVDKQHEMHNHTKIIRLHPTTNQLLSIRYNPYDRSGLKPKCITTSDSSTESNLNSISGSYAFGCAESNRDSTSGDDVSIGKFYRSLAQLGGYIEDSEAQYWLKLEPGVVLFIDNWRVLHGRAAYKGIRQIAGCYLSRDDWMSAARLCVKNTS